MREIVTVQVGSFANYIGSHFWNFQDELLGLADDPHGDPMYRNHSLNMDVLYRPGENQGVPNYTPRLVSIGTQGSLGTLSSSSLFSLNPSVDNSKVITWKGRISREVAQPLKKNLFLDHLYEDNQEKPSSSDKGLSDGCGKEIQDKDIVESLENDVYYWSDFSKVQYHPKSLFELHTSWVNIEEFENYGSGRGVLSDGLQGEEISGKLRFFVEECDHIQGIQFVVDDSGGFSSVTADFMETIADDYNKVPVLLYTARSPASFVYANNRKQSVIRALHDAVSFSQLTTSCQLIIPVGQPSFGTSKLSEFLCIDDAKLFHSSAIYAAALNCMSLPFRMESLGPAANPKYISGAVNMGELVQMITGHGWENMVAILDASLPLPSLDGNNGQGYFQKSFHPLNHEVIDNDVEDPYAVETVVTQGALQTVGFRASISEVKDAIYSAYQSGIPRPRFSHFSSALCPLPIPLSFPSIFRNLVGKQGELLSNPCDSPLSKGPLEVESIPVGVRLRSSRAILPFVEKRSNDLRRFGIQRGAPGAHLLRSWGFSEDEVEEMGETLFKMVRTLDPRPEISSDSD